MAFDGTLKFDTAIDQAGFSSGLEGLGNLAKSGFSVIGGAVTAASGAVGRLGAKAISVGKEFEAGMSQVQATLGISVYDLQNNINGAADTMQLLTEKAEEMGATTQYTAAQAAEGLNILAMSGYDAAQSVSMIDSTLSLAAAGGLQLGNAAQYIAGSMKGFTAEASRFKDETEASAYYADMIAKGATLATTNVDQLGAAMSGAAAIANSYGQTSQTAEVALLRLAEQGEVGSEAATMLSAAMKNVYTPLAQAEQAMEQLGVRAYDESGNMRDFNTVVDELHAALSEYSPEEASKLEDAIFGIQGKEAFDKMVVSSQEKVQNFYKNLAYTDEGAMGSAAMQAEAMMDNLQGDITYLESALDGLYNALYKSMNGTLRELVKLGNGYVTELTDAFNSGGFEGAAEKLGSVLSSALGNIGDYLPDVVGIGSSIVSSLLDGISENSGSIINTGLDMGLKMFSGFGDIAVNFLDLGANLMTSLASGIETNLPRISGTSREILLRIIEAVGDNLPVMLESGAQIVEMLSGAISDPEALTELLDAGLQIITALAEILMQNLSPLVGAAIQIIASLGSYFGEHALELVGAGLIIVQAIVNAVIQNLPLLLDAAVQIVEGLAKGIEDDSADVLIAIENIIQTLLDFLLSPDILQKIGKTGGKIIRALIPAAVELAGDLLGFAYDLFDETTVAILKMQWGEIGKEIVEGIISGLTGADFNLDSYLADFGENWISGLKEVFGIHSPSAVMRDEIGKNLALGLGEGFSDNLGNAAEQAFHAMTDIHIDPAALNLMLTAPPVQPDFIQPSPTAGITNYYETSNSTSSTTNNTTQSVSGGDIIIPVQIGGEQIETIVITAAQIANARSGGETL